MFDVDDISVLKEIDINNLYSMQIKSPNGLRYKIIDDYPDNQHTYLKLSYFDDIIFEKYIKKFKENSVFDMKYFEQTHHHYLFRMDGDSLKQFLNETNRCISVPFSQNLNHYVYIDEKLHEIEFASPRLHLTADFDYDNSDRDNQKWIYTYDEVRETAIARIVYKHCGNRYTVDGYPRASEYKHYKIVGDHFHLIGIFNGHFQEIFSLRYSPVTLELHLKRNDNTYSYLTNQSCDDLLQLFKTQFFEWLASDGNLLITDALKDHDFSAMSLDDSLNLLEMAII